MNQISAADNHNIQMSSTHWRLLYHDKPLAEGSQRGFRYGLRFGSSRRLPEAGNLLPEQILQVVLGWQQTDESWHLGLVLDPDIAEQRGSRWCELAHWPDPDNAVFQDLAQLTGQQLAQALDAPFHVIQPQQLAPTSPLRELPDLPLKFADWQMETVPNDQHSFVIKRTRSWTMRKLGQVAWYGLWLVVYLVLSLATLISDIALPNTGTLIPNPRFLPYIGLGIVVMLVGMMLYQLFDMLRQPNQIFIDGSREAISAWTSRKMRWAVPRVEIQSIYISELVKKNEQAPATEYAELNLHLGGGDFHFVLAQEQVEENEHTPQPELMIPRSEDIREMNRAIYYTDLQAAALYIAEALGKIPVWYDLRVK
jgi:hypothetical protein